jgi:anti-anti-sigma factor
MGRFELFALSDEGKSKGEGKAARLVAEMRPAGPSAALKIEQTVIWAEARQISIRGELDLAGADALRCVLADTVGSGLPCIVLDLSRCEFLDAAALGVVVGTELELAANGQELMVDGATGQVERLIELGRAIWQRSRDG